MSGVVEAVYFSFLDPPNLRIKKPTWLKMPSSMMVYGLVLASYFLFTGGLIYDVIVEPPSIGSVQDERGNSRPVAFMQYRVNGQYIMEGLAASFMFTLGGLGFVLLDVCQNPMMPKLNRLMLTGLGFFCVIVAFFACRVFMRMKLPGYMQG